MSQVLVSQLSSQFAAKGVRFFKQDQLAMIEVENDYARAIITTHGASVLSYTPKGSKDLLWVSPAAVYSGHKPVRGGIPICWPWFGEAKQAGLPAHGFVRNQVWQLDSITNIESGATEVILSCEPTEASLAIWPHQFHLELRVQIGKKLVVSLTTVNKNDYDIEITEALHTYFNIAEAAGLLISGVQSSVEYDTLQRPISAVNRSQPITLAPPMDSVFTNQLNELTIHDAQNGRNILIEKQQASSTVVWNPGPEVIKGFADLPEQSWTRFVCVEAGNVFENAITISAGQQHHMSMALSLSE